MTTPSRNRDLKLALRVMGVMSGVVGAGLLALSLARPSLSWTVGGGFIAEAAGCIAISFLPRFRSDA